MSDYIVPRFLEGVLNSHKGPVNPRLLFYRFLNGESDQRIRRLEAFKSKADLSLLNSCRVREEATRQWWRSRYGTDSAVDFSLSLTGRMTVGMGIASDFENGLLLHWVHGYPYINGEALKGAARAWAFETLEHEQRPDVFQGVFGSINKDKQTHAALGRGEVIFFDALPASERDCFDIDILTPHYSEYYTGEPPQRPGGWEQPNPVAFLSVSAGVRFDFFLAGREPERMQIASEWLKSALVKRGMGAKKRAGYGHFAEESSTAPEKIASSDDSPLAAFMGVLEKVEPARLIGQAAQLVDRIRKLPEADQKAAALRVTERIDKKTLKAKGDKAWAIALRKFRGED